MKDKRECKFVQNLLPNYIDKLTDEETNSSIEEHLNSCEDCKKIFENMQKEIDIYSNEHEKKEIDYIKKYSIRLKVFKTLTIVFLLIILVFSISVVRRMIILTSLMTDKQAIDISNCHYIKKMFNSNMEMWMIFDEYSKDNISLAKVKIYNGKNNSYIEQVDYYKNEIEQFSISKYWDKEQQAFSKNKKYLNSASTHGISSISVNLVKMENLGEYIDYAINSKIKSTKYEGKECYVITKNGIEIIVEKSTGFTFKSIDKKYDFIMYGDYSVGTVTDEDIQRPDEVKY